MLVPANGGRSCTLTRPYLGIWSVCRSLRHPKKSAKTGEEADGGWGGGEGEGGDNSRGFDVPANKA